tara:strand:- start:93 stop:803 length:711 start_codon:yes stop_codon:yes gene_type:complete
MNRELVKEHLSDVLVVDLPTDSSIYPKILTEMNVFESIKITDEDLKRRDMYSQQEKRIEFENKVGDFDEFLKQMNIEVKINEADNFTIPRISQLTLKTNQFNLTTKRYKEDEIKLFSKDQNKIIECAEVKDKFGNNGITGVYIIEKRKNEWIIDTFLLSCRIIGRGVENCMLSQIIEKARKEKIKTIKGKFIPTQKNKPAEKFYEDFGFSLEDDYWVFNTDNSINKPEHIKVIKNE